MLQAAQRSVLLFSKRGSHNHWSHDNNLQPPKETTCELASPKKGGKSDADAKMARDDGAEAALRHHCSLSEGVCDSLKVVLTAKLGTGPLG